MTEEAVAPSKRRRGLIPISLVVFGVALALRVPGIGERSFWFDEAATLSAALAPDVSGVLDVVARTETGKGPIYYVLLHWWAAVFGESEAALRWMSALAGAGTAAVAAWWAGALVATLRDGDLPPVATPRATAFIVGLLLACHPLLVLLSRDARSYTLSHLFLALAAAAFVPVFLDRGSGRTSFVRVASVAVPAALGVSCHLFSGFFVGGLFAALLFTVRDDRRRALTVLGGAGLFAVLIAAQLPLTLQQVSQHYAIARPAAVLTFRDWAHYAIETIGGKPGGIVLTLVLAVGVRALWRDPVARFAVVLASASLGTMLLLHFTVKPLLIGGYRYVAWVALPTTVAGVAAAASLRRLGGAAAVVLVVGMLISWTRALDHERTFSEDWRAVAACLSERARDGDLVLCHRSSVESPLRLYYDGPTLVARSRGYGAVPELAPAEDAIAAGRQAFLVWSHAGPLTEDAREQMTSVLGPFEEVVSQYAITVLRFGPPR